MKNWQRSVLLLAFALGACATAVGQVPPPSEAHLGGKTIFITRHMQKAEGSDPPLNREGAENAERLADMLEDKNISAIFATSTRRAMETAAPLAKRRNIAISVYDPRNPQALVTALAPNGGAVLIVGHSNTVHDLVERFGGLPPDQLAEDDYGRVFEINSRGGVREFSVSCSGRTPGKAPTGESVPCPQ